MVDCGKWRGGDVKLDLYIYIILRDVSFIVNWGREGGCPYEANSRLELCVWGGGGGGGRVCVSLNCWV